MSGIWKTEVHLQGFMYDASALQTCTAAYDASALQICTAAVEDANQIPLLTFVLCPTDFEDIFCSDFDGAEWLTDG